MRHRWQATLSIAIFAVFLVTPEAVARGSLIEIYMGNRVSGVARDSYELVVYGEQEQFDYRVAVVNEEGSAVFLAPDLSSTVKLEVERDGNLIPEEEIEAIWGDQRHKYEYHGGLEIPFDKERLDLIEVGVGLKIPLIIRRINDEPFSYGHYVIKLFFERALLFTDGSAWHGRGGRKWHKFELIKVVTAEDLIARKISLAGKYASLEQLDQAAKIYLELVELRPNDQGLWDHLGLTHIALGNYREGIECFLVIWGHCQRPGQSPVPYAAARAYLALGNEGAARKVLSGFYPEEEIPEQLEILRKIQKLIENPIKIEPR